MKEKMSDSEELEETECTCEHCKDKRAYQELVKRQEKFTELYIV